VRPHRSESHGAHPDGFYTKKTDGVGERRKRKPLIAPLAYTKPRSLAEALELLQIAHSLPLAGGTDLLVELKKNIKRPALLVDLKGISDLDELALTADKGLRIGANVTMNRLIESKALVAAFPALADAAITVGTDQIRNRATVGGNLCHASPSADLAPPLFVLDAQLVVAFRQGERRIPMSALWRGAKQNTLQPGELLVRIEVPWPGATAKMGFLKKMRTAGHDLALVNIAGLLDSIQGRCRICIGGCGCTPVLLPGTDALYQENRDPDPLTARLLTLAEATIAPIDDVRASARYRRQIVAVLLQRLLKILAAETKGGGRC
jgi:CO/xanthine dehydrogenase FAD-binding subunit